MPQLISNVLMAGSVTASRYWAKNLKMPEQSLDEYVLDILSPIFEMYSEYLKGN